MVGCEEWGVGIRYGERGVWEVRVSEMDVGEVSGPALISPHLDELE